MKEQVLTLAHTLCGAEEGDRVLDVLCEAACSRLNSMLADGVTAEDCRELYLPAAAWLAVDMFRHSRNWEGVTSLSAGDMTVRCEGSGGELEQGAMSIMAPYLKDKNFVFRGVRG